VQRPSVSVSLQPNFLDRSIKIKICRAYPIAIGSNIFMLSLPGTEQYLCKVTATPFAGFPVEESRTTRIAQYLQIDSQMRMGGTMTGDRRF
jgi:hypothetical protein